MLTESPSAKLPEEKGEAPWTQYHGTGLIIQELLKSVKGFQTSLESLSAKVEGIGKFTSLLIYFSCMYIPVIRIDYRSTSGK